MKYFFISNLCIGKVVVGLMYASFISPVHVLICFSQFAASVSFVLLHIASSDMGTGKLPVCLG
jgi:hypothetical protein